MLGNKEAETKKHILTVARAMNSAEQVTVQMFFGDTAELPNLLNGAHEAIDGRYEQLKLDQERINAAIEAGVELEMQRKNKKEKGK